MYCALCNKATSYARNIILSFFPPSLLLRFEKLISGKYLGAITHAALLKLVRDGVLFKGTCSDSFKELVIDRFDSAFLSQIEGKK